MPSNWNCASVMFSVKPISGLEVWSSLDKSKNIVLTWQTILVSHGTVLYKLKNKHLIAHIRLVACLCKTYVLIKYLSYLIYNEMTSLMCFK